MMRLLAVTAHPDDEAGAFGGSLLLYHARGVETYVVCLTPGQAASNRGPARSDSELASIRREEFAAACKMLHVTRGEILDCPDGALDRQDLFSVVGVLTERVRRIRPHIIITMGPEGGYTGHTDHAMASVYATMAFHWAARKDRYPDQLKDGLEPHRAQKLYYCTASFVLPDRPPVSLPPCSASIDIRPFVEEKIRAFEIHATQAPLAVLFARSVRRFGGRELFHLAAAAKPAEMRTEDDLFAGVAE